MSDPKRLLVAGDNHGNIAHFTYLLQQAQDNSCDAVFQVGDFGYWEHSRQGMSFLENLEAAVRIAGIPVYWIDGNHENHRLLRKRYGPGGKKHQLTPEGFWVIRENIFYVPRGTRWTWQDKKLMGLGGAYSIDKDHRLYNEQTPKRNMFGQKIGPAVGPYNYWWPEEELTDEEIEVALQDRTPLDVLFTHDKPRAADLKWGRHEIFEGLANQDKIQKVVLALQPKLLIHGHFHYPYRDEIRCGDDNKYTRVIALAADVGDPGSLDETATWPDSWEVLNLEE